MSPLQAPSPFFSLMYRMHAARKKGKAEKLEHFFVFMLCF
jgi:hypothetical protein